MISKATDGAGSGDWVLLGGSVDGQDGAAMSRPGPKGGPDYPLASPPALNDGRWHHLVWTRSAGGENCLYLDGTRTAAGRDSGGAITSERPLQIGGDPFLKGKFLDGWLAEVAMYGTVLDKNRVVAHLKAAGMEPRKWAAQPRPAASTLPTLSASSGTETRAGWIKHPDNPVLGGELGTCFDVSVLRVGDTYRMYFSWRPKKSIALVESRDGVTWSEPRIVLGPQKATGWEDDLNRPVVVRRGDGYHLYYTGQAQGKSWIGYAASTDGQSWKRMSDKPVLSAEAPWDTRLALDLLPDLIANYQAWEQERLDASGLFWQVDDRDGMEVSISGALHPRNQGLRATINSYQYGDAQAIARLADLVGQANVALEYRQKAATLKQLVLAKLWDPDAQFFKVLPRGKEVLSDARELHGFTPWYFNLPDTEQSVAWKQLMDPRGFYAPFGPTTAEQRHPNFAIAYQGHECQWNGPSWPFATSVTLTAMANLLNNYRQDVVTREDYFDLLRIYATSHRLKRNDGTVVPWIDENLNPLTGDWISRTRLKSWKNGTWDSGKGGEERGKDYNHSTFCDLVIAGLIGLRPRTDQTIEVNPLVPEDRWDWFCLDHVAYHGRTLTILYDRTGTKYGRGQGLRVLADGKEIAASEKLGRVTGELTSLNR